jgi:hypothetical protein
MLTYEQGVLHDPLINSQDDDRHMEFQNAVNAPRSCELQRATHAKGGVRENQPEGDPLPNWNLNPANRIRTTMEASVKLDGLEQCSHSGCRPKMKRAVIF